MNRSLCGVKGVSSVDRQTDRTVLIQVILPDVEGGQIHLNIVTVL